MRVRAATKALLSSPWSCSPTPSLHPGDSPFTCSLEFSGAFGGMAGLGREDTGDENVEAFATRLMAKAMVGLDCRGAQPHTGAGDANHSPQRRMAFAAATPTRHSVDAPLPTVDHQYLEDLFSQLRLVVVRVDLATLDALRTIALSCATMSQASVVFSEARCSLRAVLAEQDPVSCDDPSDALLIAAVQAPGVSQRVVECVQRMLVAVDSAFTGCLHLLPGATALMHCGWMVRAAAFAVLAQRGAPSQRPSVVSSAVSRAPLTPLCAV